MQKTDSEYFKLSQWLDIFLQIPFNIYKTPAYLLDTADTLDTPDTPDTQNTTGTYLLNSRKHLDTIIYGQENTKQHIIEILARMMRNSKTTGSVFAIYGEAGTGKTTLIKEGLSHIFGLPFIFISLGGAQDRTTLSGSNYVYEGSSCGKIMQSLNQSRCMNPIFYFDELDKVSETDKGNEIINLLVHLTDYTQNGHFMDDYMDGIAIDLSRATFVFSFNNKDKISPILLDRMEIIKFKSYSVEEKMIIARQYLIPNVVYNVFNDKSIKVILSDKNLRKIVEHRSIDIDRQRQINNTHILQKRHINSIISNNSSNKLCSRYNTFSTVMKNISKNSSKNSSRYKHNKYINKNNVLKHNLCGGVRYIKKLLERIISRINLDMMIDNSNTNNTNTNNTKNKKKKQNNTNTIINQIIVSDKNINDILYN
jgi:ATP-dependent Lon protease